MRLLQAEEIERLLRGVPQLVDLLDRRDPAFVDSVSAWLRTLEGSLLANQSHITSEVSALRGSLLTVARGHVSGGDVARRVSRTRLREANAMEILQQVESVVSRHLAPTRENAAEAAYLVRQLLVAAGHKGVFDPATWDTTAPTFLGDLWGAIAADPELKPAAGRAVALVGRTDVLVLLSRALVECF